MAVYPLRGAVGGTETMFMCMWGGGGGATGRYLRHWPINDGVEVWGPDCHPHDPPLTPFCALHRIDPSALPPSPPLCVGSICARCGTHAEAAHCQCLACVIVQRAPGLAQWIPCIHLEVVTKAATEASPALHVVMSFL